jgi:hypothetical protein
VTIYRRQRATLDNLRGVAEAGKAKVKSAFPAMIETY